MQFKEIIGQQRLKNIFIQNSKQKKLPHAMMMLGNDGVGTLPFVMATIQYELCENRSDTDSCGICSQCKKIKKLIHPDVVFAVPVIKNPKVNYKPGETAISADWAAEWRQSFIENPYLNLNDWMNIIAGEANSQGNISRRECSEILKFLSMKSFESGKKFVVIWMAEFLGNEGNRLLKQIEEPEEGTYFFLIAENYEQVLSTIQSRSQLIKFAPLTNDDIIQSLTEKNVEPSKARQISILAEGNFNLAQKLITEKDDTLEKIFLDWMQVLVRKQQKDWITWVEQLAKLGREQQKQFLKYGLILLRYSLYALSKNQNLDLLNDREKAFCSYISQKLSVEKLQSLEKIFDKIIFHIERNANPKILFTHNSFEIAELF
jgi:DNA polymerase III subunit delta'